MIAPCTTPTSGFLTLTPPRDLGPDAAAALYRAGVRGAGPWTRPRGYALLVLRAQRCERLPAASLAQARAAAARIALAEGPVVIARAAARGAATVYERLEVVALAPVGTPLAKEQRVVTPNGRAIAPGLDVYEGADLRTIARRLGDQLRAAERGVLVPRIAALLETLDLNWAALSPAAADRAWAAANRFMREAAVGDVLPQWEGRVTATVDMVTRATRTRLRDAYLPRLGVALRREEATAIAQVGSQAGWFLRDRTGAIADRLTQRGREIVAAGLRDGLGRAAIGAELRAQLPGLADQWGRNYATTVAANAVSRARSWAEITAYREAGITVFEAQAVLDERTTIVCRFIDGQIVDVQGAYGLMESAMRVERPEDIYRASPFMRTVRTRGGREIRTTTGTRIAEVVRSGVGHADDRGQFRALVMGRGLVHAHIGMPPYHHACRTYTVPRVESFQVPRGYEARADDLRPVTRAPRARPRATPSGAEVPAGVPRGIYAQPPPPPTPSSVGRPPQRPLSFVRAPADNRYAPLGDARPVDDYVLPPAATADIGAAVWRLATSGNRAAAVRTYVPGERGVRRMIASGPARGVPAAEGLHGGSVLRSAEGYTDVYAQVALPATARAVDIAALVANPDAYGRHLLYDLRSPTGAARFVRVVPDRFPRRQANAFLRALEEGRGDEVRAQRLIDDGVRRGWLRLGSTLEEVSFAPHGRVSAAASGATPAATMPPVPPRPAAAAKGVPPAPAGPVAKVAPLPGGLSGVAVGPEVYAARPPGEAMARAAWGGDATLYRAPHLAPDGSVMEAGVWRSVALGGDLAPPLDRLALDPHAAIVQIYHPAVVRYSDRGRVLASAIRGDLARGSDGVREYLVHDVRGACAFLRVDGRAARTRSEVGALLARLDRGDAVALEAIAAIGIATADRDLLRFYPAARVAWERGGLLPGVALAEQVARRVDAVRREVTEQVRAAQGGRPRFPARGVFADILRAAARRDALPGRASAYLRKSNNVILRGAERRGWDEALQHASGALLLALQTLPLPTFAPSPGAVNNYVVPAAVGGAAAPGRVFLRPQDALAVGWGRAGQWTAGQRRASRARVRRILQHHVDRVGLNAAAGRLLRNRLVGGGPPVDLFGDGTALAPPGAWADPYDARAYGSDHDGLTGAGAAALTAAERQRALGALVQRDLDRAAPQACEWGAAAHEIIARDDARELQLVWETAPDLIAGYIATMRGAFVPF